MLGQTGVRKTQETNEESLAVSACVPLLTIVNRCRSQV